MLAGLFALNKFHFWDITSGRELARLDAVRSSRMESSPHGSRLAVMNDRAEVTVLTPAKNERVSLHPRPGDHSVRTASLSFSADERLLAINVVLAAGEPQAPEVWDLVSSKITHVFPGRKDINNLAFIPGCRAVVLTGVNKPRIWRLDPPQAPSTLAGHSDEAWSAAFSPDGKLLATGSDDTDEPNTIKLWDPATGRLLAGWKAHTATVVSLAFSPDGRYLASSSLDEGKPGAANALVWDVASRKLIASLPGHDGFVRSVAFSPDGSLLATAGDDALIRLWNTADFSSRTVLAGHATRITSVAFSPDSRRLASGSCDATVRIWDVTSAEALALLRQEGNVNAVAFSPDGSRVASANDPGQIDLWNAVTGESLLRIHSAADQLRCLAFTRDGRYVTASGKDKVIRLWDITTGQEALSLFGHQAQVNALAYSPNGKILASCSHDGAVKLCAPSRSRWRRNKQPCAIRRLVRVALAAASVLRAMAVQTGPAGSAAAP